MIRQRRKSQTIVLDISVYTNPLLKKDGSAAQDSAKEEQAMTESNMVVNGLAFSHVVLYPL